MYPLNDAISFHVGPVHLKEAVARWAGHRASVKLFLARVFDVNSQFQSLILCKDRASNRLNHGHPAEAPAERS